MAALGAAPNFHPLVQKDYLFGEAGNDFIQIGNPDPHHDEGYSEHLILPTDNRTYVNGGVGNDVITVTRHYEISAIALDGPTAGSTIHLFSLFGGTLPGSLPMETDIWASDYANWQRADSTFYILPDTPAFTSNWRRDGVALVKDEEGQLNLYPTFQFPVAEFSALYKSEEFATQQLTRFAPAFVYWSHDPVTINNADLKLDNDDTSGHNLFGDAGNDMIEGGWGNDVIDGGDDNDALDGERGDDTVFGGSGEDLLLGGEGNDTLDSGTDNDTVYGEDGNDAVQGGSGNDSLIGGKGNDTLSGGDGTDIYVFNRGDGQDTVEDDSGEGSVNTLRLGEGVLPEQVQLANHVLTLGGNEQIRFSGIARIEFDNGADAVWSLDAEGDVTKNGASSNIPICWNVRTDSVYHPAALRFSR
ncbi:MAG: calcium-binding protein [Methylovulum sp.]|nr:calcium-binding protein [Methylovulum sp.]